MQEDGWAADEWIAGELPADVVPPQYLQREWTKDAGAKLDYIAVDSAVKVIIKQAYKSKPDLEAVIRSNDILASQGDGAYRHKAETWVQDDEGIDRRVKSSVQDLVRQEEIAPEVRTILAASLPKTPTPVPVDLY